MADESMSFEGGTAESFHTAKVIDEAKQSLLDSMYRSDLLEKHAEKKETHPMASS